MAGQKQIQAKPDDGTKDEKGLKFSSLQPPDISEAMKITQEAKTRKRTLLWKCGICGIKGKGGCNPVSYYADD